MGLTVAVTGPTGEIGMSAVAALERAEDVERVIGMARRPFDPTAYGWTKTEYRQGDVLDRAAVDGLVEDNRPVPTSTGRSWWMSSASPFRQWHHPGRIGSSSPSKVAWCGASRTEASLISSTSAIKSYRSTGCSRTSSGLQNHAVPFVPRRSAPGAGPGGRHSRESRGLLLRQSELHPDGRTRRVPEGGDARAAEASGRREGGGRPGEPGHTVPAHGLGRRAG